MQKNNSTPRFIVGLDIGYSNLKIVYGYENEEPKSMVLASTAQEIRSNSNLKSVRGDYFIVNVNDKKFITGCDASYLYDFCENRCLRPTYTESEFYKALFFTALSAISKETDTIDVLITGLPVSVFSDKALVRQLRESLIGTFNPSDKITVSVNDVLVVPQPVGAFLQETQNDPDMQQTTVLVADPGFYSFDWVLLEGSIPNNRFSGSSLYATSVVIEETMKKLNSRRTYFRLEDSIRAGKDKVDIGTGDVPYQTELDESAYEISKFAVNEMYNNMRLMSNKISHIILVGGGSKYYEDQIRKTFPDIPLVISKEPVLSNALGFWHCAD